MCSYSEKLLRLVFATTSLCSFPMHCVSPSDASGAGRSTYSVGLN